MNSNVINGELYLGFAGEDLGAGGRRGAGGVAGGKGGGKAPSLMIWRSCGSRLGRGRPRAEEGSCSPAGDPAEVIHT